MAARLPPPERVFLESRAGRNLARYFPDLVQAITESLPPRSVVDGEIAVLAGDRIDFAALQRRITVGVEPAHPAYLIAFDLLQHPDHGVILSEPLSVRRDLLAGLLADAPPGDRVVPAGRRRRRGRGMDDDGLDVGGGGAVTTLAIGPMTSDELRALPVSLNAAARPPLLAGANAASKICGEVVGIRLASGHGRTSAGSDLRRP